MADKQTPRLRTLYQNFAIVWTLSGMTIVRARSAGDAQTKFDAMSRATMLNRSRPSFHRFLVAQDKEREGPEGRGDG